MYEALRAIRQACERLNLGRDDVEAVFSGNVDQIIRLSRR